MSGAVGHDFTENVIIGDKHVAQLGAFNALVVKDGAGEL